MPSALYYSFLDVDTSPLYFTGTETSCPICVCMNQLVTIDCIKQGTSKRRTFLAKYVVLNKTADQQSFFVNLSQINVY